MKCLGLRGRVPAGVISARDRWRARNREDTCEICVVCLGFLGNELTCVAEMLIHFRFGDHALRESPVFSKGHAEFFRRPRVCLIWF